MEQRLVAVNIGTSKIVLAIVDRDGARAAERGIDPYEPNEWINNLRALAKELALGNSYTGKTHFTVCGTSGSFVLVDDDLNILAPVSLYNETYEDYSKDVIASVGENLDEDLKVLLQPNSSFLKLIRQYAMLNSASNTPIRCVMPQSVWLLEKIVGDGSFSKQRFPTADFQNCRKLGVNIKLKSWPVEYFNRFGIPSSVLPSPVDAGSIIGTAAGTIAAEIGIDGATVYHGTTDATAEGLFLTGCSVGSIGVIAGSTTSIKAVLRSTFEPSRYGYFSPHPIESNLWSYTTWVTAGELLRRVAISNGSTVQAAIEAAWSVPAETEIPLLAIQQTPIKLPENISFSILIRGIIESLAYWEATELRYLFSSIGQASGTLRYMGGTTRDERWNELRAAAIGRSFEIYESVGALGAILPALIKLGWPVDDFLGFLGISGKKVKSRDLHFYEKERMQKAELIFGKRGP